MYAERRRSSPEEPKEFRRSQQDFTNLEAIRARHRAALAKGKQS